MRTCRRLENVGDQRPSRPGVSAAGEDRSGGRAPPTAASARSSSKKARQDSRSAATSTRWATRRVETCELHFADFRVPTDNLIGGHEGQRLQARDDRARGGAAERRRARAGRRAGRVRSSDQICPAAADLRQADRAAPDDSNQAGGDGHPDRSVAAAHLLRRRQEGSPRTVRCRGRHGQAFRHRNRARRFRWKPCGFSAATGFRRTFRSSASTGTRHCCSSAAAATRLQRLIIARGLLERYAIG